jgi:Helix-turn-helix domain
VSVEATSWALNLAPVPADRGGQRSSACRFVLVGLANHAGPDGTGAFPSVATLVRYTRLSERTVRTCLDRLEAEGIISPCDPGIVAAWIKRADRRPQGWDLNLSLVRNDLDDAAVAVLEHQFPGLGVRLAAAAQLGADGQADGVHSPHPVATGGEAVDNWPDGVQQLHPEPRTGCNRRADGVQLARLRGATGAATGCSGCTRTVQGTVPGTRRPAREAPSAAGATDGGGPVGEFFAVLGADWRLTGAQRARLTPAVATALNAGWTQQALAAFTGANTSGVRNPYAVLAARLSSAELPPPRTQRPSRPPRCGECDQVTRMLGFDGRCRLACHWRRCAGAARRRGQHAGPCQVTPAK